MSKLGTLMASCCRGVQREEASHKLNLKMRPCTSPRVAEAWCYTELRHYRQGRPAGLGDDQNNASFATLL